MSADLHVELRPDVDDAEWGALLASDPRAHVLQSPVALRVVTEHDPSWTPSWYEVRDTDGHLRGGMGVARRTKMGLVTSLAGWGGLYAGPVAAPGDADAEARLARVFSAGGGVRTIHRELVWARADAPRGPWAGLRPLDAAVLDVDPAEPFDDFLQGAFPKNRRNEGKRSDRRGLRIEVEGHARSLARFHPLYAAQCAQWGTPPVGLGVLEALVTELDEALVFVAIDAEDRVVGAHVCFDLGDELFAWVGTTERRKDVFPSTVLVREEARWCHQHGRRRLNLGSSIGRAGIEGYKKLLGARWDRRWIVDEDRRPWRRRSR